MKIRITRSAERDLLDGFAFYERQAEGVGTYFLDSLLADIDSLVLYAGCLVKNNRRHSRKRPSAFPRMIVGYCIYAESRRAPSASG